MEGAREGFPNERRMFLTKLIVITYQVVLVVKNLPASAGDIRDMGLISWLGRSPGEGNSNLLQYSYLKNPMDRGSWGNLSPQDLKECT